MRVTFLPKLLTTWALSIKALPTKLDLSLNIRKLPISVQARNSNQNSKGKWKKEVQVGNSNRFIAPFQRKVENLSPRNTVHYLLRKERKEFPPTVPRYPIFFFLPRKTWVSYTCDHILALPISSISSLHFSFTNQSKIFFFFFDKIKIY